MDPYLRLIEGVVSDDHAHPLPDGWVLDRPGWTRYDHVTKAVSHVDVPLEDCMTFDVEVCVREGPYPVIATALTTKVCSKRS